MPVQRENVSYAVSPKGGILQSNVLLLFNSRTGGKPGMRAWVSALLLLCCPAWMLAKSSRWQTSLEQLGLQSFDREVAALWMSQQGVVFLTPDKVLVYQVNRTQEQAKLAPRGAAGGAGNFFLNIRVLGVQDGRLLRSLDVPTNGMLSRVMATKDGGFLVRAGTAIYLYSPDFVQRASRELELEKKAPYESWQVRISPSGAEIFLLHEQVYKTAEVLADNTVLHDGEAKVDVEVLSSETLKPVKKFTLTHTLAFWAPAEDFLVSSNPAHSYSDMQVGIMDFNGSWSPIHADFQLEKSYCGYSVNAIDQQRVVLYGCENFIVLSTAGKKVFTVNDPRFIFGSTAASGGYLAVSLDHYRFGQEGPHGNSAMTTHADRVAVYDLDRRSRVTQVSIHGQSVYYAISPRGDLAVVDGLALELVPAGR
jgi:hypothetical protein